MLQLKQFKLGIIVLCSFLLGNCKKKIIQKPSFSIDQQEAKFIDIPIPLYDERLFMEASDSAKQNETVFGYRSPLSSSMIIDFYVHEMERLGWKQLILFHGVESLIQFESPTRFCSISIRLSKTQSKYSTTDVVIFIGKKNS